MKKLTMIPALTVLVVFSLVACLFYVTGTSTFDFKIIAVASVLYAIPFYGLTWYYTEELQNDSDLHTDFLLLLICASILSFVTLSVTYDDLILQIGHQQALYQAFMYIFLAASFMALCIGGIIKHVISTTSQQF